MSVVVPIYAKILKFSNAVLISYAHLIASPPDSSNLVSSP